jgi:hypothetical protein
MDFFTYTNLYAIGSIEEIMDFKRSLPIDKNLFDFRKIIPIPTVLQHILNTSTKDEIEKLKNWRRDNWGTPGNGNINEIREIYGHNEMALEIKLSTPFNEPLYIIDKITEANSNLQFFTYHLSFNEDEYIGFKTKEMNKVNWLCEITYNDHYEQQGCKINQETLLKIRESNIGYLQLDFLRNLSMGNHIIKNL